MHSKPVAALALFAASSALWATTRPSLAPEVHTQDDWRVQHEYDTGVFAVYQPVYAFSTTDPPIPTVTVPDATKPNEHLVTFHQYPSAFVWRDSAGTPAEEIWLFPRDDHSDIQRFVTTGEGSDDWYWRMEFLDAGNAISSVDELRDKAITKYSDLGLAGVTRADLTGVDRHVVIAPSR